MAVDLTFARQRVEEIILIDRCTITRPNDPRTAIFDETTGLLNTANPVLVAADLPCSAREHEVLERGAVVGGAPKGTKVFTINLSADYTDVQVGDVITFTTSTDPRLLNVPQNVSGVHASTLRVMRRVQTVVQENRLGVHPG